MSDSITSGTVDAPINDQPGTAETKETPASTGTGPADPGSGDTSKTNGNVAEEGRTLPDDEAEGGKSEASRNKPRWKQDIERLREDRRQRDSQIQQLNAEKQQLLEALKGGKTGQPQTKPDLWSDPDAYFEAQNQKMLENFQRIRQEERQAEAQSAELRDAAKFVRSQKGMTEDDVQEIRDILRDEELDDQPPMRAARLALALWKERKGISDKSDLKARASMPSVGQSPGASHKRTYSQGEMDAWVRDLELNPSKLTPDVEAELRSVYAEGRIR
jgi:hypothetical protein